MLSSHLGRYDSSLWVIFQDLGGKSSVSFSGVFMSAICRLKACSGGTLMSSYSGEKLQGEVYQEVNQLIPHCQFYPGRSFCGELGTQVQGSPWASSEGSSLSTMRGSHLLLLFCFSLGNLFSSVPPPYSKHIVPSPVGAYLSSSYSPLGIQCRCQKSGISFCIFFLLLLPVQYFKSNIYQLRRVHSKCPI